MRIAIISGYTGGICSHLAKMIEREDIDEIWAISRRALSSPKSAKRIRAITCDITEDLSPIEELLCKEKPDIMWLVNGAGVGYAGDFTDMSADKAKETLDLNCQALTALTHLCFEYLVKGAHIINFASCAGFCPQPHFAVYSASKAYVISFSYSLSCELRSKGISVTAVCSGAVDTPFIEHSRATDTEGKKKRGSLYSPISVAEHAYKCAKRRKCIAVYGLKMKLCHLICKLLPSSLTMSFFT